MYRACGVNDQVQAVIVECFIISTIDTDIYQWPEKDVSQAIIEVYEAHQEQLRLLEDVYTWSWQPGFGLPFPVSEQ